MIFSGKHWFHSNVVLLRFVPVVYWYLHNMHLVGNLQPRAASLLYFTCFLLSFELYPWDIFSVLLIWCIKYQYPWNSTKVVALLIHCLQPLLPSAIIFICFVTKISWPTNISPCRFSQIPVELAVVIYLLLFHILFHLYFMSVCHKFPF